MKLKANHTRILVHKSSPTEGRSY